MIWLGTDSERVPTAVAAGGDGFKREIAFVIVLDRRHRDGDGSDKIARGIEPP